MTAVYRTAEIIAHGWYPDQTVQDNPELITVVCMPIAQELADAGLLLDGNTAQDHVRELLIAERDEARNDTKRLAEQREALLDLVGNLAPTIAGEHHRWTGHGCACQAMSEYHVFTIPEWCEHVVEIAKEHDDA